jgi:hypothetical protein
MLTMFSTPKPFNGRSGVIQKNALKSWTLLHHEVQVILFGDEPGALDVCGELGLLHEPVVRRNQRGTKFLNYIFDRANEISRHKILCYANCDIMLGPDFRKAVELSAASFEDFLVIGRRWDTKIAELWDFAKPDWAQQLWSLALRTGTQNGVGWVDYFCFSRDLYYKKVPPFLVGRNGWDPWLIWFASHSGIPTIDVSHDVVAVHQNHDYAYLGKGNAAAQSEEEAKYNWNLADPPHWHYFTTSAAGKRLVNGCFRTNRLAWCAPLKRRSAFFLYPMWFSFLKMTRPVRHSIGLRKTNVT